MADSFEIHTGRSRDAVMAELTVPALAEMGTFNVVHFGAMADGKTDDTDAINRAITACSQAGGGMVFVPSGVYATVSIHLKSDVALVLDAGASLKAMASTKSLIQGKNLNQVKILGSGTIDGIALPINNDRQGQR